jgi:hypothetical protein
MGDRGRGERERKRGRGKKEDKEEMKKNGATEQRQDQ